VLFRSVEMNEPEPIIVLTTGGTIDKSYFDDLSRYQIGDTVIEKLLKIANVHHPHRIVEFLRKDSLDMTDEDRAALRQRVEGLDASRIVITHGTDTMTKSARAVAPIEGKTIVFTGALSPARFSESDATFNVGMAFATAQIAPPGVYIAMNGTVFRASEVNKDRDAGRFVRTEPQW
jgi:L-asparaginase